MKKALTIVLACLAALSVPAGCTASGGSAIHVISREESSGTRTAFIELLGVETKDEDGNKIDRTIEGAEITKDTSVMLLTVAGDPGAIGYISMGSLNNTVKALRIDGVAPGVEAVRGGGYPIARPFQIITKGELTAPAQAFYSFILSAEGQAVAEAFGCVPNEDAQPYAPPAEAAGKVVVAGSSSVSPLMDKLIDAFAAVSGGVSVELQQSDSTTGVSNTLEGLCDIGMISRGLKAEEEAEGLTAAKIATDGIAVIVSNQNEVDSLTKDQVRDIYIGEIAEWSELHA